MSFSITSNDNYNTLGQTGAAGDAGTPIDAGTYTFKVDGTWNSGSVILKWNGPSSSGSHTKVGSNTTLSADGMANAQLARGTVLVTASGIASAAALNVDFLKIDGAQ